MWDSARGRATTAGKGRKRKMNTKGTFQESCKESVLNLRDLLFEHRWRGPGRGKPRWDNTRALDPVLAHVSSSEISIALPQCPILTRLTSASRTLPVYSFVSCCFYPSLTYPGSARVTLSTSPSRICSNQKSVRHPRQKTCEQAERQMNLEPFRSEKHIAHVNVVLADVLSRADELWAPRRRRSKAGAG